MAGGTKESDTVNMADVANVTGVADMAGMANVTGVANVAGMASVACAEEEVTLEAGSPGSECHAKGQHLINLVSSGKWSSREAEQRTELL